MAGRSAPLGGRPQLRGDGRPPRSRLRAGAAPPHPPERVFRMLSLREYRDSADRLADHLPWAALVAPGVVLGKDGRFLRVLAFRGPDLESATEAEPVYACARGDNALRQIGRASVRERVSRYG